MCQCVNGGGDAPKDVPFDSGGDVIFTCDEKELLQGSSIILHDEAVPYNFSTAKPTFPQPTPTLPTQSANGGESSPDHDKAFLSEPGPPADFLQGLARVHAELREISIHQCLSTTNLFSDPAALVSTQVLSSKSPQQFSKLCQALFEDHFDFSDQAVDFQVTNLSCPAHGQLATFDPGLQSIQQPAILFGIQTCCLESNFSLFLQLFIDEFNHSGQFGPLQTYHDRFDGFATPRYGKRFLTFANGWQRVLLNLFLSAVGIPLQSVNLTSAQPEFLIWWGETLQFVVRILLPDILDEFLSWFHVIWSTVSKDPSLAINPTCLTLFCCCGELRFFQPPPPHRRFTFSAPLRHLVVDYSLAEICSIDQIDHGGSIGDNANSSFEHLRVRIRGYMDLWTQVLEPDPDPGENSTWQCPTELEHHQGMLGKPFVTIGDRPRVRLRPRPAISKDARQSIAWWRQDSVLWRQARSCGVKTSPSVGPSVGPCGPV